MRLLILGDTSGWHVKDLQRAAGADHEVVTERLDQLLGSVSGSTGQPATDVRLPAGSCYTFDAVLVRAMPHGSLEQVISTMNLLGQLDAMRRCVVNPPRSLEIAIDKYLTTLTLNRAGARVPATILCQSVEAAFEAFEQLGGDVVLKPLFGGEGRGLMRIREPEMLERASRILLRLDAMLYLQQFVPNPGWDYRLFVLGEQVWGMRRQGQGDWRTNLSRGGAAEPVELTSELADIGRQAAHVLGCEIAGVDVIPGEDGQHYVIEVNAVPGWRGLARTLDLDVSAHLIRHLSQRESQSRP